MFNLGPMEVLVIIVVALVVLGPQRLPDAMRQVGKGIGEAKRWSSQLTSEVQSAFAPGAGPASPTATTTVAVEAPSPTTAGGASAEAAA